MSTIPGCMLLALSAVLGWWHLHANLTLSHPGTPHNGSHTVPYDRLFRSRPFNSVCLGAKTQHCRCCSAGMRQPWTDDIRPYHGLQHSSAVSSIEADSPAAWSKLWHYLTQTDRLGTAAHRSPHGQQGGHTKAGKLLGTLYRLCSCLSPSCHTAHQVYCCFNRSSARGI